MSANLDHPFHVAVGNNKMAAVSFTEGKAKKNDLSQACNVVGSNGIFRKLVSGICWDDISWMLMGISWDIHGRFSYICHGTSEIG